MDFFPIYEALWRRAQAEGARVQYVGPRRGEPAGYFHPKHRTIAVTRPYYRSPSKEPTRESNAPPHLPQPDLLAELITLAHEYGHFRSWAGRTDRAEYEVYDAIAKRRDVITAEEVARMPKGLTKQEWNDRLRRALYDGLDDDARARILREETLAWEAGREVLAELGHTDFTLYDERTRTGLHNHRYRLGMEDLWPGDVAEAATE